MKNILTVKNSNENFDSWVNHDFIPEDIKQELIESSILIVPQLGFRSMNSPVFPKGTESIVAYFEDNLKNGYSINIAIGDSGYSELSLYSNSRRFGTFIVKDIVLPIFLGLLTSCIFETYKVNEQRPSVVIMNLDNSKNKQLEDSEKIQIVHSKDDENSEIDESDDPPSDSIEYLHDPSVSFTITVVDSNNRSKTFTYNGSANQVGKVTEAIQEMWDEENK